MCVRSVSVVSKFGKKQCNYGIFIYMVMDLLTNLHKCVNINGTEDSSLLGCNAVSLGPDASQATPFEESRTIHPSTLPHMPEGLNPKQYRCENLTYRINGTNNFERLVCFEKLMIQFLVIDMTVSLNVPHYKLPILAVGKLSSLLCIRTIIRLTFRTSAIFTCLVRQVAAIRVWLLFTSDFISVWVSLWYTLNITTYLCCEMLRFYIGPAEDSSFPDVTPILLASVTFLSYNDKINQSITAIAATLSYKQSYVHLLRQFHCAKYTPSRSRNCSPPWRLDAGVISLVQNLQITQYKQTKYACQS